MFRSATVIPLLLINLAVATSGFAQTATATATEPAAVETRSVDEVIADQVFTDAFLGDPGNIAAGKQLWEGQCALCHGAKAYPGKAPKLKAGKYKPEFVFKRAYKGFKGMPEWRDTFTIDEIRTIVAYVKSPGFSP
jgi:mono/diheme cytochrome c family protein